MEESEYTVERSIEDITFSQQEIEEFRKKIKKELIDEDKEVLESVVERRLKKKLVEVARDRTQTRQGHSRLHNEITHQLEQD